MTAAAPKVGSSVDSDSDQAQHQTESWPLPGPGPKAGSIDDGDHARSQHGTSALGGGQQQQQPPASGKGQGKRPWWRTRIAIWSFILAAFLLVVFVVLLTLGLLGYLKVGSFSSRNSEQASSNSEQRPPNPLSTIPLLSEPTFTYVAPAPPPVTVTPAAAAPTPSPTNLGTLNIVRCAMTCRRCPLWSWYTVLGVVVCCNGRFNINSLCSWSSRSDIFVTFLPRLGRGSLLVSCPHSTHIDSTKLSPLKNLPYVAITLPTSVAVLLSLTALQIADASL